jgi:hypothetical protein
MRRIVWFGAILRKCEEMVWFGRRICIPVKKRFPTLQHLVESGILNDNEREIIQKIDEMYIQVKNARLENGTSFISSLLKHTNCQQQMRRVILPTE